MDPGRMTPVIDGPQKVAQKIGAQGYPENEKKTELLAREKSSDRRSRGLLPTLEPPYRHETVSSFCCRREIFNENKYPFSPSILVHVIPKIPRHTDKFIFLGFYQHGTLKKMAL